MENTSPDLQTSSLPLSPPPTPDSGINDTFSKVMENPAVESDKAAQQGETYRNMDWGDTFGEVAQSVPNGIEQGLQAGSTPIFNSITGSGQEYRTEPRERTTTGTITEALSQQLPYLLPAAKVATLGRAAWAESSLLGSKFAASSLGAVSRFILETGSSAIAAFPGNQSKLADSLPSGTIFDSLKTDPASSETMNRFRNAVDGVAAGGVMEGFLKGLGIVARKVFSKEAGVAAETVSKNTADDIAQFRKDYPSIAEKIDEARKAAPHISEEEAFTSVMQTTAHVAQNGGKKAEDLAKLLTFVNGDNEAKAQAVDKSLAPIPLEEPSALAPASTDIPLADSYKPDNRIPLEPTPSGVDPIPLKTNDPLALPAPGQSSFDRSADRQFQAFLKSDGTRLPSSGETLITPEPLETQKFLQENLPKSEAPASPDLPDEGPDELAKLWPIKGNVAKATAGLEDADSRALFHKVRMFAVESEDFPSPKQVVSKMKAEAAAMSVSNDADAAFKARLAKMKPAEAQDMLNRVEAYYDPKTDAKIAPASVDVSKPKAEVISVGDEEHTVQTYNAGGVRVHAESHPGGKSDLFVSIPKNTLHNDRVTTEWNTFKVKSGVDRADLKTEIANAATDANRYYQTVGNVRKGYAQVLDGRATVGLFKSSDVSTIVHELTHAYDLLGVAPEFFGKMREALGFSASDQSKASAEAVAQSFERFAFNGELDNAWQKPGFQKLSKFMTAVYKDVEKTPIGLEVSDPVRMAFRGMGGVAAIGDHVGARPEVEALKEKLKSTDFNDPKATQDIFDQATKTWLNLGTIRGQDAQAITKELQNTFDTVIMHDRGGVETHASAVKDAISTMVSSGGNLSSLTELERHAENLRSLNGRFLFWRGMTQSWTDRTVETLRAFRASPDDAGLQKQFEIAFDSFSRMRLMMQDIQTESARLLGKHKIVMPEVPMDLSNISYRDLISANDKTGGKLLDQLDALLTGAGDDPAKKINVLRNISQAVKDKTYNNLAKSLYMSSILSHPRVVFGVQAMAGLANSVLTPARYVLGGAVTGDKETMRFGLNLYYNLFHTALDMANLSKMSNDDGAVAAIVKTFKQGTSVSDADAIPYLRPSTLGLSGTTAKIVDGAYAVGTSPLRIMNTIDEFWRQLYGRAYLRSMGMDSAAKQGIKMGTPAFEDTVAKFVDAGFSQNGAIISPEVVQALNDFTFKKPLAESKSEWIQGINRFAKLPFAWLFQPLVRTPVNIGREAAMSIPGIGFMSQSMREGFFSNNPRIAAAYRGRQVLGTLTLGMFGTMAYNSLITGSGPDRNTNEGQQWYNAGYRPYSLVFHNGDGTVKSVGYMQLEPFSTVAGLCANAVEKVHNLNTAEQTKGEIAGALAASVGQTYSDKRYLTGLAMVLKWMSGDSSGAEQALSQIGSGFIPLSGAQAGVSDLMTDGELKHAQGLLQRIEQRTLLKPSLEPRRDFFGAPIKTGGVEGLSPLPIGTAKPDPVTHELLALDGKVTNGYAEKLRGIDLHDYTTPNGQSAYDRRAALRQDTTIGGHTLHEAMQRVIQSKAYQNLNFDVPELKQERANMLMKVVGQYNTAIQQKLFQEFPNLKTAYMAADPQARRLLAKRQAYQQVASIPK